MTTTTKYKVKQDRVIYHGGIEYVGGSEVELPAEQALYHADNLEVAPPTHAPLAALPKDEAKKTEPKP